MYIKEFSRSAWLYVHKRILTKALLEDMNHMIIFDSFMYEYIQPGTSRRYDHIHECTKKEVKE